MRETLFEIATLAVAFLLAGSVLAHATADPPSKERLAIFAMEKCGCEFVQRNMQAGDDVMATAKHLSNACGYSIEKGLHFGDAISTVWRCYPQE